MFPKERCLARAKREGGTQQIATAKLARDLIKPAEIDAIIPLQSAATTIAQRGQRHVERMASVSETVMAHVEHARWRHLGSDG